MGRLQAFSSSVADRRRRRQAQALSTAVAELPMPTRRAMLDALEADELIVGAYTDRRGRVCPMLAAHRRGARTDVGSFPRAWDAFGEARRPRAATDRELEILKALLEEGCAAAPDQRAPSYRRPADPGCDGDPALPGAVASG